MLFFPYFSSWSSNRDLEWMKDLDWTADLLKMGMQLNLTLTMRMLN